MGVRIKVWVYLKYRPENIFYLDTFFQLQARQLNVYVFLRVSLGPVLRTKCYRSELHVAANDSSCPSQKVSAQLKQCGMALLSDRIHISSPNY